MMLVVQHTYISNPSDQTILHLHGEGSIIELFMLVWKFSRSLSVLEEKRGGELEGESLDLVRKIFLTLSFSPSIVIHKYYGTLS